MVLIMVCAIIIPSLLIGLVVAIFQAATSINEQTLSFLPRLIVTLLALMLFGHWMTTLLMDFFFEMIARMPTILF
jgi:flagellar biosynthetic protein FliQ